MLAIPYGMRTGPAATLAPIPPWREMAQWRWLLLGLLFLAHVAGAAELVRVGRVVSVTDGDTLVVLVAQKQIKVRLTDIDAPERKQPFGTRSRQSLSELCAGKDAVLAERGKDRYGRTLGRVTCLSETSAGVDANAEQVRRGLAWVYVQYAPKDSPLFNLEQAARLGKRGLWADDGAVPPWEWREMSSKKLREGIRGN